MEIYRKVSIAIIVLYILLFVGSEYLRPVRDVWYNFLYTHPGVFVFLGVVAVIGVILTSGGGKKDH